MKTAIAVLALFCVSLGCKEKQTVSVEDVFKKADREIKAEAEAATPQALEPIKPKTGTIFYQKVKGKKAIEAEQKRAKNLAGKDCDGDFRIINDDYSKKKPGKAPVLDYICEE